MKWDIIKSTWQYKEPKFFSVCNWLHRFGLKWTDGIYPPGEGCCICIVCHTWWSKWYHNRHDQELPPYFKQDGSDNLDFYNKHPDGFFYPKPELMEEGSSRWLNGIGVALKREKYPDL